MMIKSRASIFFLACALNLACIIGAPPVPFTPANTTICFDLHDVVLKRNHFKRFKISLANLITSLKLAFNNTSRKGCVNGEEYALRLRRRGFHQEAELVRQWAAAYEVNPEVLKIINTLKGLGYTVCIASNIGDQHLNDLINPEQLGDPAVDQKQKDIREALDVFDELLSVNYTNDMVIAKPQPAYFNMLQMRYGLYRQILFIDDNQQNIQTAQRCGLQALHFTSAEQLLKDLKELGIL